MKKNLVVVIAVLLLMGSVTPVLAAEVISLPNPLCPNGPGSLGCVDKFTTLIATITRYIATLAASLAVIMFLWAGILFLTSAGSEQRITNAKRAVLLGVVGLLVALIGAAIVVIIQGTMGAEPVGNTIYLPNPLCPAGGGPGCNGVTGVVQLIADILRILAAALAVVMFLWAGILFLTSAGNEQRIGTAKKALIWGAVGLLVALSGTAIIAVIRGVVG